MKLSQMEARGAELHFGALYIQIHLTQVPHPSHHLSHRAGMKFSK